MVSLVTEDDSPKGEGILGAFNELGSGRDSLKAEVIIMKGSLPFSERTLKFFFKLRFFK